ncbi:MAG TPA: IclR family transcriptional regulator [Paracoccus sp. (in: a-proteobacteria)]|uniref:IclR family transcriptional regulator n=1 Tax=Paracoccus sp. TaxID=267 RepID=UPI002C34A4CF|nr:IclR family transcriptional regulator [Paracoccus sp. (in: a-proteobacteria)]HWL55593.1 IclR family transcriptional regulator [Paracoccus sp. (in: a-proteobacteria)]
MASTLRGEDKLTSANSTADRAIEILLAFDAAHPVWTPTALAQHLNMPRSTIYRYFNSLKHYGLIIEDREGGFQLSAKIVELARVAKGNSTVLRIARPYLERLSEKFGEFTSLRELIGPELVPLDRIDCRHHVRIPYLRNTTLPWPATAGAKVMLAFLPPNEVKEMFRNFTPRAYTPNTITDPTLLERELERVRKQGFAISNEERDEGVSGVAGPIFSGGRLTYCIALGGPAFRFVGNNLAEMTDEVLQAVQAITRELAEYET